MLVIFLHYLYVVKYMYIHNCLFVHWKLISGYQNTDHYSSPILSMYMYIRMYCIFGLFRGDCNLTIWWISCKFWIQCMEPFLYCKNDFFTCSTQNCQPKILLITFLSKLPWTFVPKLHVTWFFVFYCMQQLLKPWFLTGKSW